MLHATLNAYQKKKTCNSKLELNVGQTHTSIKNREFQSQHINQLNLLKNLI